MPFTGDDLTAGAENEFQAVVVGAPEKVDLPRAIEQSAFYRNLMRRTTTGDTPPQLARWVDDYLQRNESRVWENSWVVFPLERLSAETRDVLDRDLRADKRRPERGARTDARRFFVTRNGVAMVRVPISYLLKLSLAQALFAHPELSVGRRRTGVEMMKHFLNDNTSPETYSCAPVTGRDGARTGCLLAEETLRRFLLTQALIEYAQEAFGLAEHGQRAMVYAAPTVPLRQRQLNDLIPEPMYRELFMSPCLSGWDEGEAKHQYMGLCHQVLSRSRLCAMAKLREAGIITRNLVALPNVSNTSLANNGVHVSLGSRRLGQLLQEGRLTPADEKYVGDLIIKIVEHFLPLFAGTYSAAPHRLAFEDFHPETVLGFLPHELDYTHLRMMWRRWKKKADLRVLGHPWTPFGPPRWDRAIGRVFRLRGDCVPDFRLLDYLVSPMSTAECPALDGRLGNDVRLRVELAEMGVFDARMAHYTLYRLRSFAAMGYTGFEGRHYSVFPSLSHDMSDAVDLQALITALAVRYVLDGRIRHEHIPDTPVVESERRHIFFGAAMGLPTFYVRNDSPNRFLQKALDFTTRSRRSHRYQGYTRVMLSDYRRALLRIIRKDAADLVEAGGHDEGLRRLEAMVADPSACAARRLSDEIAATCGRRDPLNVPAGEFNAATERFYRENMRLRHLREACDVLKKDAQQIRDAAVLNDAAVAVRGADLAGAVARLCEGALAGKLSSEEWLDFIHLQLVFIRARHHVSASSVY